MSISGVNNNSAMINGLWVNVDPRGEIARKTYLDEMFRQFKEMEDTTRAYYSKSHQENLSFESPYNHILNKYIFSDSLYFRSDMSQKEREMAFRQERAILWESDLQLNDPYALAASGGVRNIDKVCKEAVQTKLAEKKEELIKIAGGESTYQPILDKIQATLDALVETGKLQEMCERLN